MEYPKLTRAQDSRFKLSEEDEKEIVRMRGQGYSYVTIAGSFGISESSAYEKYKKQTDPEWFNRRKLQRAEAQNRFYHGNPTYAKKCRMNNQLREKHLRLHADQIRAYDAERSLAYYRENREEVNPKRNKRRREANAKKST